jgi:Fe-S-cluster-containing hydrogenase component 2
LYVINSKCTKCDICLKGCPIMPDCNGYKCRIECGAGYVCPVGAIIKGETQNIITDKCIDCGNCVYFCQAGAISPGLSCTA